MKKNVFGEKIMRRIVHILILLGTPGVFDCEKDAQGNSVTCINVQSEHFQNIFQLCYMYGQIFCRNFHNR